MRARLEAGVDRREPDETPAIEEPLSCGDPPLRGRPDRVERFNGRVVIVDLKTGIPPEEGISRSYRVQLLFYAALLRCATGEQADEVAIEWIDGSRDTTPIDPLEVESLVSHLLELLHVITHDWEGSLAEKL